MLIRFTVGNFLSFNEPQEFSMISGKVRSKSDHIYKDEKINILKLAAIFGANGSGKSNLINSMKFAQATLLDEIPTNAINDYCRMDEKNKYSPSTFEFEIKIGKKYYAYGFGIIVNSMSIVEEWLYEIGQNASEQEIFVRNVKEPNIKFGNVFNENIINQFNVYASGMVSDDNVLFLTELNRNKKDLYANNPPIKYLEDIYNWFNNKLTINYPNEPISHFSYFMDEKRKDETNEIISSLGLGINNCQIVDENLENLANYFPPNFLKEVLKDIEKKKIAAKKKKSPVEESTEVMLRGGHNFFFIKLDFDTGEHQVQKLQFEHEKKGVWFELSEESDGTLRMLDLVELIFAANSGSDKVYVIDEIDRSLHPQLTYKLIESYLKLVNKSELQLIVTTHEAHILDLNLLRRDEIWFVNKDKNGESSLYSLDQYNTRFDKRIDKAYLDGRYGGVPLFDEIFPMKGEN